MAGIDGLAVSAKQLRSIAYADADASKGRVNIWHGAVRSGKTIGSLVAFLAGVADAPEQGEIVVIGRTRDTIYRNLIGPLQNVSMYGSMTEHIRYNRGAPTAEIFGRTVHVIGASDVRSEAVIRGMTICLAYLDETTLVAEEFFNQLVARMSVPNSRIFTTTNPDGPRHWLKTNYIDRAEERGHRVFHFELEDNRAYLPEGYIEGLEAQYTGLWRDRFVKGLWTLAEGAIYECFDEKRHVVDALPAMQYVLSMGIDYGTTNPTRGHVIGLGVDNRLYVIAEWAPGKGTTADRESSLRAFLNGLPEKPRYLYVDPAAAEFKVQLQRSGYGSTEGLPGYANGNNKVVSGIGVINALLSTDQLLIHSSCTELIAEFPGYVWDVKKTEKGEDAPVKLNDHCLDDLRYGVVTPRALWQSAINLEVTTT